jgi:hypothetical protein
MTVRAPSATVRADCDVTFASDESDAELHALSRSLARRGLRSEIVVPAALASRPRGRVTYIRRLDPGLRNAAYVAEIVSHLPPGGSVNTPGSVRAAEWLPLASAAFREHDVPQPRRIWCLNNHDLQRASRHLGFPVVAEGIVSHRRALAAMKSQLPDAVRSVAVGRGESDRGVFLEQWLEVTAATVAVLVIAGRASGMCLARGSELSADRAGRVQETAVRAVEALGGTIMAAIVVTDRDGNPYVRRVDAAPRLAYFGRDASDLVAAAIARRLRSRRRGDVARAHG